MFKKFNREEKHPCIKKCVCFKNPNANIFFIQELPKNKLIYYQICMPDLKQQVIITIKFILYSRALLWIVAYW